MRVIAGMYRSRSLLAPPGLATRPTSDRLRESLFSILAPQIAGAAFVDCYAGSGAIGIEALSRGARQVTFIENAPAALAALRANLAALGIEEGFHIEAAGVPAVFSRLTQPCQILFLDPPYDQAYAYERVFEAPPVQTGPLLDSGGIVIAEHRRKQPLRRRYGQLERYRVLEQGDAALSFYQLAKRPASAPAADRP